MKKKKKNNKDGKRARGGKEEELEGVQRQKSHPKQWTAADS